MAITGYKGHECRDLVGLVTTVAFNRSKVAFVFQFVTFLTEPVVESRLAVNAYHGGGLLMAHITEGLLRYSVLTITTSRLEDLKQSHVGR